MIGLISFHQRHQDSPINWPEINIEGFCQLTRK